jgi:transposase
VEAPARLGAPSGGLAGMDIAEALKVSAGAVRGWLKRARAGGVESLRRHPAPCRVPKRTAELRATLPGILAKGAEAHDIVGDVWTTKRVTLLIKRVFGVSYHPAHSSRLQRQEGLSLQKPLRRASQRAEATIAAWRDETWPVLRAKPRRRTVPSSL